MLKFTLMVLGLALAAQAKTRISRLPDQIWRIPKFRTSIEEKIVGGDEVTPHSIPYQVSFCNKFGDHFCGGSIASAKHIITAAHCCAGHRPANLLVRAGKHDLSIEEASQQDRKVAKVHMHPAFDPRTFFNDICVLELESPLDLNEFVQVVPLAKEGESFSGSAIVSGWGSLSSFGESPNKLRSVEVPLLSDEECRTKFYGESKIEDSMMCAGEEGKDSCQGDSGGPLLCGGIQCGVASWGYGCGQDNPGVYTEISYFADFLNGWINA